MNPNGLQQRQLQEALVSAFPTREAMDMMVRFGLNQNLSAITSSNNLQYMAFELIRWAVAGGRLDKLLLAALEWEGGNAQLVTIAQELGVSTQKTSSPASPQGNSLPSDNASGPTSTQGTSPSSGNPSGSASTKAPSASPGNAGSSLSDKKTSGPFEVFISYSHQDKAYRNELNKHLSNLKNQHLIAAWFDGDIVPGTEWRTQILQHLESAQIILLLISADFMDSEFCYSIELKRAIERHKANEARVIPIILRATDWEGAPFADLLILPEDAKPVNSWLSRDDAYASVVKGIRRVIKDLQNSM